MSDGFGQQQQPDSGGKQALSMRNSGIDVRVSGGMWASQPRSKAGDARSVPDSARLGGPGPDQLWPPSRQLQNYVGYLCLAGVSRRANQ